MFACTQYTLLMEGSGLGFKPMPEKSQDFIDYQQNMGATILCKRQYSLGCFLRHGDHRPKVSTSMASLVSIELLAVHSKNICAAHKIVTLLWAMMGIHSFITIYL